jgi:adenine-specific DNA-methyltransferase
VNKLYEEQPVVLGEGNARWVLLPDGSYRGVTAAEKRREEPLPKGARLYKPDNIQSQGASSEPQPFVFEGKTYNPGANSHWKANFPTGMERLATAGRIHRAKNSVQYRRFADDFPYTERGNIWTDTLTGSFTDEKLYVVQTNIKVAERCLLLTTDPGDLVLDMTCGSGTTAYVAESSGRRWITCDTSRVPMALARQRLLTATFPYYQLKDEARGPAGGFVYVRKQNKKGEEVGGIVPHIKLETIANNEPPTEEVLVDRPEIENKITRISGPFCVEATIPTPVDWEGDGEEDSGTGAAEQYGSFIDRMLEVLRKSPLLHLGGGKSVTLKNIRPPAKTLSLSAEAMVDASAHGQNPSLEGVCQESVEKSTSMLPLTQKPVALVFGPESGAVSEKLVHEALKEADLKGYTHLYVIGFAIQPNARMLIENAAEIMIPATYVQATPDLMMGDLLKNMRSSQIFSVCGLPEIQVHTVKPEGKDDPVCYQVELVGLDVFDPTTMETDHRKGNDVPAWFLDTNYNGLCFHVSQAFFPRTSAWENLKKALKSTHEESVWDHLAGTMSAPFEAGENTQVAVKVIDDRGNELQVIKSLKEAN